MGRLVALKTENEQAAKSTGSVAVQGKTGRLVKLGTTQQTTAPQAPFKTGKTAEAAQPTGTTAARSAAVATVRQPTLSLTGGARSASNAGGFSHSSGKIDLPSFGERVGKTLTGAAKQYAAGAANAAGLSSAGQRGTAMSGVYEEQAQALDEQVASLEASLTNGALTPQQRKDTLDTIALVKQQRDNYRGAVRSGEQTAGEVYKAADALTRSGTEDIERAKEGLGSVGKTAIDVGVAGSQMLGDAALGGLTGSALAPMFLRSMGASAQEARQAGASHEQQLAYGLASGALSVATEKMSNLAKPFKAAFGGGVFDRALESALAKMNGSAAGKVALSFLSEGGEEVVEDLVQPVLQSIYNGQTAAQNYDELTLSEVLYDGLIGGILGGLGGGVELLGDAAQRRGQRTAQQQTQEVQQSPAQETPLPAPQTAQERAEVRGDETTLPTAETAPTAQETDALAGGKRIPLDRYATAENIDGVSKGLNDGSLAVDAQGNIYRTDEAQHIDQRTSGTVGARSVKAFQFDHPEVHQYYRETAAMLMEELNRAEKGGETIRIKAVGVGDDQYLRMKRYVSDRIATLLDDERLSYNDIERALDAIINNHGQENFAAAKRVELMLDDMLSNGYRNIFGEDIAPNEAYLAAKRAIPGASEITAPEELPIWDIEEPAPEVSRETLARNVAQVRDAAAALGENGSRALSTVYNEEAARSYAPEDAVRDFYQVYNAALGGKQSDNTTAPEHVRLAAQNAGERDARIATQAKYFGKDAQLVRDSNWKKAKLTSRQSYALDALAKVTGTQIRFADTVEDGSANASYSDGVITLALDARDPVMTSVVHETVHRIRETAPEAYEALASFVQDSMSEESSELNLAARGELYGTDDISLLTEETVADAFGTMLEKSDVLEQFTAEHRSAAQRIRDALHDLLVKISRALGSKDVTLSDNQRAAFRDLAGRTREMETLFTEALKTTQGKALQTQGNGGTIGNTKFSKYWRPKLTAVEWELLNRRMEQEIADDAHTLDEATKWAYANEKGVQVFVLYGIGDGTEATVLYAVGGKKAAEIYRAFIESGKEFEYGTDRSAKALNSVLETLRRKQGQSNAGGTSFGEGESTVRHGGVSSVQRESNERGSRRRSAENSGGVRFSLKTDTLDPNEIIPVNDVTDEAKYAYLVKDFRENGYDGRPVVVWEQPDGIYNWQAVTGSHRILAAREAGIEIPAVVIENPEAIERLSEAYRDDVLQITARELFEEGLIDEATRDILAREEDLNFENYGVPYEKQMRFSLKSIDEMEQRLNDLNEEYRGLEQRDAGFQTAPEYLALMDAIGDARASKKSLLDKPEALSKALDSYSAWQEKSGYSEVIHRMEELRGEMKTLRGKLDSAREQAAQEVKTAMRAGYDDSMAKSYATKAARRFGTTSSFDLAGYLTTNGTLLDFSDRQGYRVRDHREITDVLDFLPEDHGYSDGMIEFMNLGNIRLQSYGIDISKAPNAAQRAMLRKFFLSKNGDVAVDFSDENGRSVGSLEYDRGTSADRILNDIDTYFRNGSIPDQSVVSQFHGKFSKSTRDVLDAYAAQYGEIPAGEKPSRTVSLPRRTAKDKYVSQTIRTVLEAKATPDVMIPTIEDMVAKGDFSYDRYTDKQAVADAEATIKKEGWQKSLNKWKRRTKTDVSKEAMATGWALYNNAASSGDVETALDILNSMVSKSRNAAQALQAVRILKKQTPSAQLYGVQRSVEALQEDLLKEYGDKAPDLKIDTELAKRYMNAATEAERDAALREIYRDIGRQMPSRFTDRWNAWRYLSMLGNPRTHVRNIVGNAGFAPLVGVKNLVGTGLESAANAVTGGKVGRTKAILTTKDTDLVKAAWNDYATIEELALGGGKYDDSVVMRKEIEEGRRIFGNTGVKAWDDTLGKGLETARKFNSKALDREDVWFSKPHYASALAQYCKANGITAAQIASGKGLEAARSYAVKEAQKATYRDTNDFSQMVSRMGRRNGGGKNNAEKFVATILEGILPFRKTPANILARGVEYSPIELMKSISYDLYQVKKGNMEATEMLDHLSTGLTGTGVMLLGAYMAAEGLMGMKLRGGGGGDDEEKDFDELRGHQAYSLELPDGTSITLDWLAPEVLPLFVGTNLIEQMRESRDGELAMADVLEAISNVSDPLLQMSCLQSLNDLFDSVGYAASGETSALASVVSSAATSYLTQALPTLLGQLERMGEGYRMTTYTDKNKKLLTGDMQYALGRASSRLPGWDYGQIPYIDAWGRTEYPGDVGERAFNNFLNPAYTSRVESSAMENELERLYDATDEAGVLPERAERYFSVGGERKDLTGEEYVKYASARGQTAYRIVNELTGSAAYRALSDSDKAAAVEDAYKVAKASAKMQVSDYEPDGMAAKCIEAKKKYNIDEAQFILIYQQQGGIESLKDSDGETINLSKGLQVMELIYQQKGLSDKQRAALFEAFNVPESIRHYNKALVGAKLKAMRKRAK